MAINVNVQYDGGLLPDIILLTQGYYHRGTHLNAMKRFCICSLRPHLNVLTLPLPDWGMLRRSRYDLSFSLNPRYSGVFVVEVVKVDFNEEVEVRGYTGIIVCST